MKIYIDLELLLNFCYDLLLLLTVDTTLKRHTKFYRLIISSLLGSLSILILFIPFNKTILFILKIFVSIIMLLIAFGFKNIKYTLTNIIYLYMVSVILGGFLYFLDIEFSYKREGLLFYFNGLSINYLVLLAIAPFILYLYIKEHKRFISTYNYSYEVEIYFSNSVLKVIGYIDTGNRLKDIISGKYIILLSKRILTPYINNKSPIYVPFKGINNKGILECFKIKYLKINNKIYKNYLVAKVDNNFNLNGVDCLLNAKLREDL